MASRLPTLHRTLCAQSSARTRAAIAGSRIDTTSYTATGGSGLDSTTLSANLEEASAKARAVYRTALRDIPEMRKNFTIIEDRAFVVATIRDLFEKHKDVTDPKIVDMLVFKAMQELREIREQWKSRHHVYAYIHAFHDKVFREEIAEKGGKADADREAVLRMWKERGLVPAEVQNWGMFERWKEEEDAKFEAFAVDNRIFSRTQLERNAGMGSSGCTVM